MGKLVENLTINRKTAVRVSPFMAVFSFPDSASPSGTMSQRVRTPLWGEIRHVPRVPCENRDYRWNRDYFAKIDLKRHSTQFEYYTKLQEAAEASSSIIILLLLLPKDLHQLLHELRLLKPFPPIHHKYRQRIDNAQVLQPHSRPDEIRHHHPHRNDQQPEQKTPSS